MRAARGGFFIIKFLTFSRPLPYIKEGVTAIYYLSKLKNLLRGSLLKVRRAREVRKGGLGGVILYVNIRIMKLLIVESPAKAKTIGKYIGSNYEVIASVGHIRDLPKSNKKAIDIDGGFIPHYEISKGKEKVVAEIKHLAKKSG